MQSKTSHFVRSLTQAILIATIACSGDTLYSDDPGSQSGTTTPRIELSASSATFNALQGAPDPPAQSIVITNSVSGTNLTSLTATTSYASSSGWLNVVLSSSTAPATLTVRASTSNLPAGTHSATITIASPGTANSPRTVSITATIEAITTTALVQTINDYRASNGLARIAVSASLTRVAEAHIRDLEINAPYGGVCNLHSWSNNGNWTGCCYTADHAQAQCMWRKPREITAGVYTGNGYEIAAGPGTGITPMVALNAWRGSQLHHDVILNRNIWSNITWRAVGAAMTGRYAVVWFGEQTDPAR